MKFMGIDPGAFGAVAILDKDSRELVIIDMPTLKVKRGPRVVNQVDAHMLADALRGHVTADTSALVEKVSAMPGNGVASMFSFGRAAGIVEGVLAGLSVSFELIPPATWIKSMRTFGGKDGSRQRAQELFPDYAHLFARKKDDGRAEAALLACYAAEREDNEPPIRLPKSRRRLSL
jgi:crossover junction endodeoxyribonuclease RuvC